MDAAIEARAEAVQALIRKGDAERAAGRWPEALAAYGAARREVPRLAVLRHNIALCQLALARAEEALRESEAAVALDATLWQAHLVRLKALRRLGRAGEALAALQAMPPVRELAVEQERIALTLHELGDAAAAAGMAQAAREAHADMSTQSAADLELNALIGRLYDPGAEPAAAVAAAFRGYAARHLGAAPAAPARRAARRGRRRVGVLSPQLHASPVYFFGIGALARLAQGVDLVFFSRGTRSDWATAEFRRLARDWTDASALSSVELEQCLRKASLDLLLDMGGWMDRPALAALAAKPAARMYKWVGGQSLTTGLAAFDGFIGDAWQCPEDTQPLYVEPLVRLRSGYVTYTPPPYLPAPRAPDPGLVLGVISNPVKVSRAFMAFLRETLQQTPEARIRFIDKRYCHAELRARVAAAAGLEPGDERVRFIAPASHAEYLAEVGRLAAVLDTFPYSGGLTTMEALALGVPCFTRAGRLFCERHSFAHCMYAGMEPGSFRIGAGWDAGKAPLACGARRPLVPPGSPRTDHDALARELLQLIES